MKIGQLSGSYKKTIRSLDYDEPLLTNRRQDSFIRRCANGFGTSLLTKSELFCKIMEFDIRDYIEIVGYEILENKDAYPAWESMIWFVISQIQSQISEYRCVSVATGEKLV